MLELNALESDALTELFNLGIGQAAAALSDMLGEPVQLSVPSLDMRARAQVAEEWIAGLCVSSLERIAGANQRFDGPFSGEALLLFPEPCSLELVHLLLGNAINLDALGDFEQEALTEIGNIILNACLCSLADNYQQAINTSIPHFVSGTLPEILKLEAVSARQDMILFVRIQFAIEHRDIQGYVVLVIDVQSEARFKASIQNFLARIAAPTDFFD